MYEIINNSALKNSPQVYPAVDLIYIVSIYAADMKEKPSEGT